MAASFPRPPRRGKSEIHPACARLFTALPSNALPSNALPSNALLRTVLFVTALLATLAMMTSANTAAWAAAHPRRAATATATPANRERQPDMGRTAGPIYSKVPGVCLSYRRGRAAGQLVAGISNCSARHARQWTLSPGNTIQKAGRCLQAAGTAARSRVILARCNGSSSQFWETDGVVMLPGVELLNPASGMCLEDPGAATAAGTPVQISACAFSAAQTWYPPPTHPAMQPAPSPVLAYPLSAAPAGAAGGG